MIKITRGQLKALAIISSLSFSTLSTAINAAEKKHTITATNGVAAGRDIHDNIITIGNNVTVGANVVITLSTRKP